MLLNHKIKLSLDNFIEHIKEKDIKTRPFISKDGRQFTCVIPEYYDIQEGQPLQVKINYHEPFALTPKVENFIEQGFIDIETPIEVILQEPLESEVYNIGYAYGSDGTLVSFKCSDNKDVAEKNNEIVLVYQNNDTKKWYHDITRKYFIENETITYNGLNYKLSIDEEGIAPFQTINEKTYLVQNGKQNQWEKKQRLTFIAPYDSILPIDEIRCGKIESYIEIDGVEYILSEEYANEIFYNGKLHTLYEDINGNYYIVEVTYSEDGTENYKEIQIAANNYEVTNSVVNRFLELNGTKYYEDALGDITPYLDITSGSLTIDKKGYEIKERYVPSDKGDVLLININNDEFYGELTTNYITIESTSAYDEFFYSEDEMLDIEGIEYPIYTVDVINFNGEREIEEESDDLYSVTLDDLSKVYFTKYENELIPVLKSYIDEDSKYKILKREKVIVDEVPYYRDPESKIINPIASDGSIDANNLTTVPFVIRRRPIYKLNIVQFIEPNLCICCVDLGKIKPSKYVNTLFRSIHKSIYSNRDKYILKAQQIRFAINKNDIYAFKDLINDNIIGDIEPFPSISLFIERNNIVLPLQLGNLHGTNLYQDNLVRNGFVKKHSDEVINPIIDIEKDIYYPMRAEKTNDGLVLKDVTNVEFYIHLRTRNQDWTVREDCLTRFNDVYDEIPNNIEVEQYDGTIVNLNETMEIVKKNENFKNTSWNIFDYYSVEDEIKVVNSEDIYKENRYYQPSDLLGFFDFNDMDIFYQKSKVGKTFLRMMLFDTPDPQKQSLLATSTIFFDSGTLFGKFTNNMSNPTKDLFFINPTTWKTSSDYISVSKEPIQLVPKTVDDYMLTLNEENRLSATITLTDKLASTNSAEGFYQYIFKGLSTMLHERTLYLRIQLNHAGHGEVIDLIQPMEYIDGITIPDNLQLIDLGDDDKRQEWKKGLEAKELYNKLYIPIKVKYDFDNNKYCWYLPENLSKDNTSENSIKFNLYEIKIRN